MSQKVQGQHNLTATQPLLVRCVKLGLVVNQPKVCTNETSKHGYHGTGKTGKLDVHFEGVCYNILAFVKVCAEGHSNTRIRLFHQPPLHLSQITLIKKIEN